MSALLVLIAASRALATPSTRWAHPLSAQNMDYASSTAAAFAAAATAAAAATCLARLRRPIPRRAQIWAGALTGSASASPVSRASIVGSSAKVAAKIHVA